MAFSYTEVFKEKIEPGYVRVCGRYTNSGGSTGGDITTGIKQVELVLLTPAGSSVTSQHVYNETLPLGSRTAVTIVTGANENGSYEIIGRP